MEIKMSLINCAECALPFAVSYDFQEQRRNDHKKFYCPRGHINFYPQKSDEEVLRDKLNQKERELEERKKALIGAREELQKSRSEQRQMMAIYLKDAFSKGAKTISIGVVREHFKPLKVRETLQLVRQCGYPCKRLGGGYHVLPLGKKK